MARSSAGWERSEDPEFDAREMAGARSYVVQLMLAMAVLKAGITRGILAQRARRGRLVGPLP